MKTIEIDNIIYKKLSEILTIKNGKDYKSHSKGNVPVYGSGGIISYIDTAVYDKPSVLIPRKGSLDKLYFVDTPFWNVDTIFYTEINTELVEPRYLYHYLKQAHLEKLNKAGGVPSLTQAVLNNLTIPLPPLPIQQEIVRILDTFTNLTAELTDKLNAELTARRKQYEYYRDELLTFGENVPYMKLGEVVNISRGGSLQKKDFVENGVPCIHYGQIYTRYGLSAKTTFSFISEECARKQKMAKQNDIIMAVTSENLDDVCKCVAWLGNENVAVSGHSAIISHNQDSKYLAYFFESTMFFNQKKKLVHGTKVIEVTPDRLKNVMIPLPPLSIQKEIVCTLDMFTKFTTELTDKLNAELVARRKQCEYYRDKLLNFQEK